MEQSTNIANFDLLWYMTALGIEAVSPCSEKDVLNMLEGASGKIEDLLNQGFYAWTGKETNVDGFKAAYAKNGDVSFSIIETLLSGSRVNIWIEGCYQVGESKLKVVIEREKGSEYITVRVFKDDTLQAERADPNSHTQQEAQAFLRSIVESRGEDPSRLDCTTSEPRDPYRFARRMLLDISQAVYDPQRTEKIAEGVKKAAIVTWVSEYLNFF